LHDPELKGLKHGVLGKVKLERQVETLRRFPFSRAAQAGFNIVVSGEACLVHTPRLDLELQFSSWHLCEKGVRERH
jgi:hypothetical protein